METMRKQAEAEDVEELEGYVNVEHARYSASTPASGDARSSCIYDEV